MPDDILLNPQPVAAEVDEDSCTSEEQSGDLTMLARGTPGWSAPEVSWDVVPSAAMHRDSLADIYSLGRTVYEVRFPGAHSLRCRALNVNRPIQLMTERNPPATEDLPRPERCSTGDPFYDCLWRLVKRCTQRAGQDRASLREIHLGLDDIW